MTGSEIFIEPNVKVSVVQKWVNIAVMGIVGTIFTFMVGFYLNKILTQLEINTKAVIIVQVQNEYSKEELAKQRTKINRQNARIRLNEKKIVILERETKQILEFTKISGRRD